MDLQTGSMPHFVIVEPGDTIDAIEAVIRWSFRPDIDTGVLQWEWALVHEGVSKATSRF